MPQVPNSLQNNRSRTARPHPYGRIDMRRLSGAVPRFEDSLDHSNYGTRGALNAEQEVCNRSSPELPLPTQAHLIDNDNRLAESVLCDLRIVLSNATASAGAPHRADNDQRFPMNQTLSTGNPGPSSALLDTTKYSVDEFAPHYGGPSYPNYFPFHFTHMQPFSSAVYNHFATPQGPFPGQIPGQSLSAGWTVMNGSTQYHSGNNQIASQPTHHHAHSPLLAAPPQQGPAPTFPQPTGHQAGVAAPPPHPRPCEWQDGACPGVAPRKNRDMQQHLRSYHNFVGNEREEVPCRWAECTSVLQRQNMGRHVVAVHLRAKATCSRCFRRFCRPDVAARHERQCGAQPSPSLNGSSLPNGGV